MQLEFVILFLWKIKLISNSIIFLAVFEEQVTIQSNYSEFYLIFLNFSDFLFLSLLWGFGVLGFWGFGTQISIQLNV